MLGAELFDFYAHASDKWDVFLSALALHASAQAVAPNEASIMIRTTNAARMRAFA